MGTQLLTNDPKESDVEVNTVDQEYIIAAETLQAEIMQARQKLMESEAKMMELQRKLDDYMTKERQIAEVMIAAQISAQKTEASARARAEVILQETEEMLRLKQRELELLQLKSQTFKEDILDRLDQYKTSVEKIMTIGDNEVFTPTLVSDDQMTGQKLIV